METIETINLIMTTKVVTVEATSTLKEVKEIFENKHLRHLPVVDGDKLVGILSLNDVLRLSFGETYGELNEDADQFLSETLTVDQVMNYHPVSVNANDGIQYVSKLLADANFHALPVIDGEKLVGIITTTDIIKYYLQKSSTAETIEGHATV